MKAILWALAMLVLLDAAQASVVISQVLYDPINTESGGEAVELRNEGNSAADISKWVIATEASAADATIPENTILQPGASYLIADTGWDSAKDNPAWKNADLEETITMSNADSGIALKDASGAIIDAVGWGSPAEIKQGLYEGTPAAHTSPGKALARKQDTGNNAADFAEKEPEFLPNDNVVIIANITGNFANITNPLPLGAALNEDDSAEPGVQLKPAAGGTRTLHLEAYYNGTWLKAGWFGQSAGLVKNGTKWHGELALEYWYAPGLHQIEFSADKGNATIPVAILELSSARIETKTVSLKASPGRTAEGKIRVRNEGNVAVDISWTEGDLVFGNASIPSENLIIASKTIQPKETGSIDVRLSVPENTLPGEYRAIVRMKKG
ncbi:MAG: lamin tail domain-containing protein [Candidatus Woesearchaeota archaeon]